jgi:putative toxin-antitoxin system antitoxin component (TIGR02293 family)
VLDQVAGLLQIQRADISTAICISPTMLARRARAGRLNTAESDRLVALIAVFEEALSLFEGNFSATRIWMDWPVRGLGQKKPLGMLGTRVEAKAVLDLIGRLERGVLA